MLYILTGTLALFASGVHSRPHLFRRDWWQPEAGTTWQIELLNPLEDISYDVAVYDIDLFDNGADIIETLHDQDRKVICYYSAGTYEPNRDDSSAFKTVDIGNDVDGWPGEKWLNTQSQSVRDIMLARLDRAQSIGCDGVDPDNVDGYGDNDTGFGLTEADAVDYVTFLTNAAHERGMASGLKNAGEIIETATTNGNGETILDLVDFSVNEECATPDNNECDTFHVFIDAGKPVFHIEYPDGAPNISNPPPASIRQAHCEANGQEGMSTLLKTWDLDDWMVPCPAS